MLGLFISLAWLLFAPEEAELLFVGDAMMHQSQINAARKPDGTYDYDACFDSVRPWISDADYAVVNLETPLGGAPYSGYPMFCAPDSYAKALRDAGFDLALTANNHCLDRRDRGVRRTIAVLDSLGMPHIGTYADPSKRDSLALHIADINGFRIGFLNYTYGTNGIKHGQEVAVDPIDIDLIRSDIGRAHRFSRSTAPDSIFARQLHLGHAHHRHPGRGRHHSQAAARLARASLHSGGAEPSPVHNQPRTPGRDIPGGKS